MKNKNTLVVFHQMNGLSNGHVYGGIFTFAGLFCLAIGVYILCNQVIEGLILVALGIFVLLFGFSFQKSHYCRVKFTEQEILLTIGPFALHRMAKTEVQTLCLIREEVVVHRRDGTVDEDLREQTSTYLLVMSPHSPPYFRDWAARWISPEVDCREYRSEGAREYAITDSAIDAYFARNMSNFKMNPADGIWLEYTPERYEALKKQLPQAVDYVNDYEEKV